ncbi:MAG TPA: polyprenyl synthetase family protein [Clostridiales bacterium]|nr:polyprenyl synthetase family protein [Clostridiales bacterium]
MVKEVLNENLKLINPFLKERISGANLSTAAENLVLDAAAYSLSSGGKRVRPVLTLEFCKLCGGDKKDALHFAAAVEFIHTYSLIHDDLPCMDDDDVRRGQPSCHVKFGEAVALLAGDALLTLAFETLADAPLKCEQIVKAVKALSSLAGVEGMIGGQSIDIDSENKKLTVEQLEKMDLMKTGALIKAACVLGCIAADASEEEIQSAGTFAESLGLAFQIIDDILDGDEQGEDEKLNKATYVSVLGMEGARALAEEHTRNALSALAPFGERAQFLREFAITLLERSV